MEVLNAVPVFVQAQINTTFFTLSESLSTTGWFEFFQIIALHWKMATLICSNLLKVTICYRDTFCLVLQVLNVSTGRAFFLCWARFVEFTQTQLVFTSSPNYPCNDNHQINYVKKYPYVKNFFFFILWYLSKESSAVTYICSKLL